MSEEKGAPKACEGTDSQSRSQMGADRQTLKGNGDLTQSSSDLISRRRFLTSVAAAGGILALDNHISAFGQEGGGSLPNPNSSGIEHVVVVMMENRSFDHFLGWVPGSDGRQAGLTYFDTTGLAHSTYPLAPDFQGCGHPDPDHSYEGGRIEYNNGACDGWLRAGDNDEYAIGYYTQSDLPFLGQQVPNWTTFDHYFAAIMAETYPNRFYQHAAQTDRIHNSNAISKLPTIWDRLAERGLTGRYYYSDVPFLALWGSKYLSIGRPFTAFLADCAAGTLPQVSFVEPRFLGEKEGVANDDHPHADIRNGEAFLEEIYRAVTTSPLWPTTVLVFNYDEWGGFFDHVPPKAAPIPQADRAAGNADGLRGFRVPCLLISPWSRHDYISKNTYDHTSILKMIEWRWRLRPLTIRDLTARNIAEVLNFRRRNLSAPQTPVLPGPYGLPCPLESSEDWESLRELAQSYGWTIY